MKRDKACQDALAVFIQYGYRKTSMEDVARAIGVSRQWVYQQFRSKEKLFGEVIEQAMNSTLTRTVDVLKSDAPDDEAKLLSAFDVWCGEYLDSIGASPHAGELFDSAVSMHGDRIKEAYDEFEKALTKTLKRALPGLPRGVQHRDAAIVLLSASQTIKHESANRKAYLEQMKRVIRVVTAGRTEKD